jgi:hypothetical protein
MQLVVMLSIVMLSDVKLTVVMLSVVAPLPTCRHTLTSNFYFFQYEFPNPEWQNVSKDAKDLIRCQYYKTVVLPETYLRVEQLGPFKKKLFTALIYKFS